MNQMRIGLATVVCVLTFGLTGCTTMTITGTPSIESSMEQMGEHIGAAMKSTNINDFAMHTKTFRDSVANASQNTYSGTAAEQTMYKEGMAKLIKGLSSVDAQVAAGDLELAKNALRALLPIRNQYHSVLKK